MSASWADRGLRSRTRTPRQAGRLIIARTRTSGPAYLWRTDRPPGRVVATFGRAPTEGRQPVITDRRVGRLLSVNVGLPRDLDWHGQVVHTAVWKRPVEGRRLVRRLNIDGDGQGDLAGHGGEHRAVFVYQIESYRHWQEQLGRDDFE
ncbi:MAG: hypothetical protein QOI50_4788, partial [Pseudonocardiales bacterium]|nr:hypothetical protein [Pseudonocardiales bacterium]